MLYVDVICDLSSHYARGPGINITRRTTPTYTHNTVTQYTSGNTVCVSVGVWVYATYQLSERDRESART